MYSFQKNKEKSFVEVSCSFVGCATKGMAYVDLNDDAERKPHFCILHNPNIQKDNRK